jgi:hypothetical protein
MSFNPIRHFFQYGLAVIVLFAIAISPGFAQQQRILVTTPGDPDPAGTGTCSLRQALKTAVPGTGVIGNCVREPGANSRSLLVEMAPGLENHHITLQFGQLEALFQSSHTYNLTVRGHGLVVDANGASRVLRVHNASVFLEGASRLSLEDLTLTGGLASADVNHMNGDGGAIAMTGSSWLILRRVTITGNKAAFGGGVSVQGGFDATVFGAPVLLVSDSTISDNEATGIPAMLWAGRGGGLAIFDACAIVLRSTLSGNLAGSGGAILTTSSNPDEHYCWDAANGFDIGLSIYRSTISGNRTPAYDGGHDFGAAAIMAEGPLRLEGTTVTSNHGAMFPAIHFVGPGAFDNVNSILSGNVMDDLQYEFASPDIGANDGTTRSAANSVVGTVAQGQIGGPGNVWSDTPELGPLVDNGGFTLTHLPSLASPAMAIGREPECSSLPQISAWLIGDELVDQRHVSRPQGASCEAGAVERRQGSFVITANVIGSGRIDATPTPTGAGSGGGIANCTAAGGSACTATYVDEHNASTLKIIATPAPGWWLDGWSGDCVASTVDASAWLSVDGARSCTATFASDQLFLDGFDTAN